MQENLITQETNILFEAGTNELEILEFHIAEAAEGSDTEEVTCFGMNVAKVMQVVEQPELVDRQHDQHPSFLGVIRLREHALPLIDLSVWLGMERKRSPLDVVIVTEFSNAVTGFLVSGVTDIHRVGWDDVVPPEGFLGQVAMGCLIGTVKRDDRIIQLLDLESVLADLDPTASREAQVAKVKASRPYPVLIADDSPTIRKMVETNLRSANFVPEVVGDGKAALERLEEYRAQAEGEGTPLSELVAIVVSDIEMPRMDGFTLTRNIKSAPALGGLPVILYSSIITDELRHKGASVGADEQIAKPDIHRMAERAIALLEGG